MNPVIEDAEIIDKTLINSDLHIFRLKSPKIAKCALPGQFVHIDPGKKFFLRRPFSIQNAENGELEILIKIVGEGTQTLVEKPSPWNIMGPLGNSFKINPDTTPILVAGGVGAAPLKFLYNRLSSANRRLTFIIGAKTSSEIPLPPSDPLRNKVRIATDDGSQGFHGTAVQLLASKFDSKEKPYIYACGPVPMLNALRVFMLANYLQGEFSLENHMACGMGVCQGCAIPMTNGYKLVCKDGPVFPFQEIGEEYWK